MDNKGKGNPSEAKNGIKTPPMYHKSGVCTTILFIYKHPKVRLKADAGNKNQLEGQYLWTETQIFLVNPVFLQTHQFLKGIFV